MDEHLNEVMSEVAKEIDSRNKEAADRGEVYPGGGGDSLERELDLFRCGQNGEVPPEWSEFLKKVLLKNDPEYAEHVRLAEKFKRLPR